VSAEVVRASIERSIEVHVRIIAECLAVIAAGADALVAACRAGHNFGNGWSAADAQHLAAEFVGRYVRQRDPMPALALNANSSPVTATGNDYGYDQVFAKQLQAFAAPGDVAVAIGTSGNSPSAIEGVRYARRLGLVTLALTGASGGQLRGLADIPIAAPSDEAPRIQERHILIGHSLCDAVDRAIAMDHFAIAPSN
jgi:D-sedoheptulose 7-phosphate isomerase